MITATTRPPRENEIEGVHYFFKSRETFKRMMEKNDLVEYTEYDGNLYGTVKSEIQRVLKGGSNATVVVDLDGVTALKNSFASSVFVVHLDINEDTLLKRLINRKETLINIPNRLLRYRDNEMYEHYKPFVDVTIQNTGSIDEAIDNLTTILVEVGFLTSSSKRRNEKLGYYEAMKVLSNLVQKVTNIKSHIVDSVNRGEFEAAGDLLDQATKITREIVQLNKQLE